MKATTARTSTHGSEWCRPGSERSSQHLRFVRPASLSQVLASPALTEPRLEPVHLHVGPPRSILLVEDNPGDIRLVREALASGPCALRLSVAHDGVEALSMLRCADRKPDLILLDLNLPALDGRAVLRQIKSDPEMLAIPVIVLTNSDAPQDVWSAYRLHANCYLVKPADFTEYEHALHQLIEFWAGIARLPGR